MNPIDELLTKGRQRVLCHLILDKAALALTIVMGGALVLLLVGTQILDWYWLALLAVAGLGAGLYQLRDKVPSLYRVAQRIDRKLGLADALSTAFHFGGTSDPRRDSLFQLQRQSAERSVSQVDLKAALPYSRSRFLLPAGALAAAALGLFVVRYAITGSLDLRGSMVALAADSFFSTPVELAKNDPKKGKINPQEEQANPEAEEQPKEEEKLPEDMMEPKDDPSDSQSGDEQGKQNEKQDQQKDGSDSGDNHDQDSQDQPNTDKEGKQDGKEGNSKKDSSMMDKLRDALANLMNKNKSDANKQSQQKDQKGQQQKADSGDKQESQNGGESASNEQGQQQDQADRQKSEAKGGENPQKPNQEASSSQGDKIGDKTIKNTEALQAMGKISELMGKRAEKVQGEVLIEVGQTKQQLKTAWSSRQANHGEGGGEIHRDEVPLMYQQFVEKYFEELRKTPEGGALVPKPAPKPAPQGK